MVKMCVIYGDVDGVDGVSLHRFPTNDQQRRQWVLFVQNCGINAQFASKLCSRHFIVGRDYRAETNRRRLFLTAVPSLVVQPVLEMAAPGGELEADMAIPCDNGMEIEAVEVKW